MNDCKRLKLLTNIVNKYSYTAKLIFLTQCKLIINDTEIIACKLEFFKNPKIDIVNQEISEERETSIT